MWQMTVSFFMQSLWSYFYFIFSYSYKTIPWYMALFFFFLNQHIKNDWKKKKKRLALYKKMDQGANLHLNKDVEETERSKVNKWSEGCNHHCLSAQNMTESVKRDSSPHNQNCLSPLAWRAIYLNCFTVSWHILEISAEGMSARFKIKGTTCHSACCAQREKKKRTFEKLNCSASFEKSWPGYTR